MNSYGFKIVLCINEISFLQLIGLKLRVIGVRIDVDCTVDFVESGWKNIFSKESDDSDHFNWDKWLLVC